MQSHVLVPVKRLDTAKSRLASVLAPDERAALMRRLLGGVLGAVRDAGVERVTLVTSEPLALEGTSLWDDHGLPWNEALALAIREVVVEPVVGIISADLPLLAADDVRALLAAVPERGIAIARATDGGTNGVAIRPPDAVGTCFGSPGSALLHAALATAAGVESVLVDRPGLAFDVDTPEDLERIQGEAA